MLRGPIKGLVGLTARTASGTEAKGGSSSKEVFCRVSKGSGCKGQQQFRITLGLKEQAQVSKLPCWLCFCGQRTATLLYFVQMIA